MNDRDILAALARLVKSEQRSLRPGGDVLERSVRARKQCGGNSSKLTSSFGVKNGTGVQFQLSNVPADVYTVHVSVLDLPEFNLADTPAQAFFTSTLATVIFGANGQQTVRQATVGQGVSLSGQCDYVNVMVTDNTPAAGVAATPFQYQVSITVAPGLRADTFGPPTLDPYDPNGFLIPPSMYLLAPAATLVVPVPQNVGVNAVQATVSGTATVPEGEALVQQLSNGGVIIASYDPRDAPGWMPLRSGVQAIGLFNNSVQDIQFSLVFGIDA
jgi:hypothetical protein